MLTEHFVASISAQTKANTGVTKDSGIFYHEYQPLAAQRHVFKKSASAPNGLAVSKSHIFAAQANKAVVHVYSRDKGNQEAIVPFPERIHSIALAAKDTVLLLGTESGRVLAWETLSGRLVSTSASHLQPVTSIAVDPTSNFFLSGSPDSMIHVWALPSILSFSPDTSRSPIHTLSTHRGPISSIICGNSFGSSNIAISVSEDKSAIIWDYQNGTALRTYLLPELPEALTLDPADRGFYVAYGDGSLQKIDFYDELQTGTPIHKFQGDSASHRPLQPPSRTRFNAESQKPGAALSLSLTWDGTTLVSGHSSGKLIVWDAAKRTYSSTLTSLPGPVTNLLFIEPTGFPNVPEPSFKVHSVVKPKQDVGSTSGNGIFPPQYTVNMQFVGRLPSAPISATESNVLRKSAFEEALAHPSFPQDMLEESLAELAAWNASAKSGIAPAVDFLSLEDSTAQNNQKTSTNPQSSELAELKKQLASLQRVQKVTFQQLSELREEKDHFVNLERNRSQGRAKKQRPSLANGADRGADGDVEMSEADASGSVDDAASSISSAESESDHSDDDGNKSSNA